MFLWGRWKERMWRCLHLQNYSLQRAQGTGWRVPQKAGVQPVVRGVVVEARDESVRPSYPEAMLSFWICVLLCLPFSPICQWQSSPQKNKPELLQWVWVFLVPASSLSQLQCFWQAKHFPWELWPRCPEVKYECVKEIKDFFPLLPGREDPTTEDNGPEVLLRVFRQARNSEVIYLTFSSSEVLSKPWGNFSPKGLLAEHGGGGGGGSL